MTEQSSAQAHSVARGVLLLTRGDIAALMRPADYLSAVEAAFRASKEGRAESPPPMHLQTHGGSFHAKGASYDAGRPYVALKFNGNFPGNPERRGLPTIQGAILLCDALSGTVLAIMDSIEITLRRTAAASALAARYLARPDSANLCICGCGDQGRAQLAALADVLPIRCCLVFDADPAKAARFAAEMAVAFDIECAVSPNLHDAAIASDVIVTCTTAQAPILFADDVRPGTFIAAVGSDSPDKNEIAPDLMAASTIVVDLLDQCLAMGDLRHAVATGAVAATDVHADLGELAVGAKAGRANASEITLFDSTGTALQDAASAALAFERAVAGGIGISIALGDDGRREETCRA